MKSSTTTSPFSLLCLTLLLLFFYFVPFLPSAIAISDYTSLVYKNCANNTFFTNNPSTGSYPQTLFILFQQLVSQSSNSKFFKTIAADEQSAISGSFQCRGDLSNSACQNCVNSLPEMATNLCRDTIAARIQLSGCYIHYETDGDFDSPKLRYKTCEETEKAVFYGYREMMAEAFEALETGIVTSDGFYSMNYEYVHVLAQCDGDVGGCDCGECVSSAVLIAQDECANSVSGEIYMDNCFMSFAYYPDGVPSNLNPEKRRDGNSNNDKTVKSVAIVVGGAAALCFGFICLFFIKSLAKKDDDF